MDNLKPIFDKLAADVSVALKIAQDAITAAIAPVVVVPSGPPVVTVPPVVTTGQTVVLQNMTLDPTSGVYKSVNLSSTGKCYLQIRTDRPATKSAVFTVYRQTNVIPDGTKNLKFARIWPEGSYPNDYFARSLRTGAEQFSTEQTAQTSKYFSMPWKKDIWQKEEYTFDYLAKTVTLRVDNSSVFFLSGWDPGALNRTQFGVQLVYAPNTGDSGGLPTGSYVNFKNPTLVIS